MSTETSRSDGARVKTLVTRLDVSEDVVRRALDLAEDVGLDEIYDGRYALSPSDLVALSDALDVPVTVLSGDVPMERHLGVSLRIGTVADLDVPREALQRAELMISHKALLDSWLGPMSNPLQSMPVSKDSYYLRAGQTTAAYVRDALQLDDAPITDLVTLVEDLGVPVAFLPMPSDVHGLNVRDERGGTPSRVIIVAAADPWTRQRFTLAHELCHALYDDTDQVIVDRVDVPEVLPELRAESFARHLLLPPEALAEEVAEARRNPMSWQTLVPRLMMRWGVSRSALVRALIADSHADRQELEGVSTARIADLMEGAGLTDAWSALSRDEGAALGSPMLVERALHAFGNGFVSVRVVADLLGRTIDETTTELERQGWLARAE